MGPREHWNNDHILGDLATSFVVQSVYDGNVQGLSDVLAGIVCEARIFQLAILKLSWMKNFFNCNMFY